MLKAHPQGVVLLVRAQPGSRREGVLGVHGDRLKTAVHAAPEKGKANGALIEVLAKALGVKRNQISLLTGETSQDKSFLINGLQLDTAQARITEVVASL
jgi:uncharacterized protein (TIGR00251 family)